MAKFSDTVRQIFVRQMTGSGAVVMPLAEWTLLVRRANAGEVSAHRAARAEKLTAYKREKAAFRASAEECPVK
jgi:hypothetical protein